MLRFQVRDGGRRAVQCQVVQKRTRVLPIRPERQAKVANLSTEGNQSRGQYILYGLRLGCVYCYEYSKRGIFFWFPFNLLSIF